LIKRSLRSVEVSGRDAQHKAGADRVI